MTSTPFHLSPKLKPIRTQLGGRIATLKLTSDALGEAASNRGVANCMMHREVPRFPVTGHLAARASPGDDLGDDA